MNPQAVAAEPRATTAPPVARARRRGPSEATIAVVLLLLAVGLLLMYAGRYLTFFYDEWTFIFLRRGGGIDSYLNGHNGHLSLFPVVVYKLLFATVGLRHYWPYRLVGTALHLVCAWLLYVLARRRMGPVAALVPTLLLPLLGTAYQDILWPFQIGYLGSIAGGLGALALLDRPPLGRPNPARDGGAAALLVGSVVSSGVGLAFAVACGVLLIAQRQPWRRLWIPVAAPGRLRDLVPRLGRWRSHERRRGAGRASVRGRRGRRCGGRTGRAERRHVGSGARAGPAGGDRARVAPALPGAGPIADAAHGRDRCPRVLGPGRRGAGHRGRSGGQPLRVRRRRVHPARCLRGPAGHGVAGRLVDLRRAAPARRAGRQHLGAAQRRARVARGRHLGARRARLGRGGGARGLARLLSRPERRPSGVRRPLSGRGA